MTDGGTRRTPGPWMRFLVLAALLSVAFSLVLVRLVRFAIGSELESYIPLVPVISAYLLHLKFRGTAWAGPDAASRRAALVLWGVAGGVLAAQGVILSRVGIEGEASALVLPVVSYATAILGAAVFCLGISAFRQGLFPWLFLYFMVPIPEPVAHGMRTALQQGSAEVAAWMFRMTGTPVFKEGMLFYLPGLSIKVAEECSGIHSSLVLLITSLVAGHIFLRGGVCRAVLVLVIIPLSLIRNGFRIVSISLLTIHVDPRIIDSPLHHRGGPVYFVLSLGVLAAIAWGLRRHESKRSG